MLKVISEIWGWVLCVNGQSFADPIERSCINSKALPWIPIQKFNIKFYESLSMSTIKPSRAI